MESLTEFFKNTITIGILFLDTSDEIHDISLIEAVVPILSLVWNKLREFYSTSAQLLLGIFDGTMKAALDLIKPGSFAKCES